MSFWHELKRRNVYKVGAAYAILALSIIAVQSDIADGFGLTQTFQRWVVIVLAAGLPAVLLFAWIYELTPTGLKRTSAVPREESITHVTGRRLNYLLGGLFVGALISLGAVWLVARDPDARWLEEVAIPGIEQRIEAGQWEDAWGLLREAESRAPGDPELAELWPQATRPFAITSNPPGARVSRAAYGAPEKQWTELGVTPLEQRLPIGLSKTRFTLDGYRPVLRLIGGGAGTGGAALDEQVVSVPPIALDAPDVLPEDMVRVTGTLALPGAPAPTSFFLGRYEVTNAEFKRFVDAGGYRNPDYWKVPIVDAGRELGFDEAVARFTDALGSAGPSTWELGDYPEGEDDYPVRGVSWYEAAAYAEWAGAELPTFYHWRVAVDRRVSPYRTPASNMRVTAGAGAPVPVGQFDAPDRFGAYDLSGNVREWLFSSIGGLRYIGGGAWDGDPWLSDEPELESPLDRDARNGLRIARTFDDEIARTLARQDVPAPEKVDHFVPQPVSDETFESFRQFYAYDPVDLAPAAVERIETRHWVREQVTFNTAYGERMPLYLYLPIGAEPPYRAIVYAPGAGAWATPAWDRYAFDLDLLVKAGYAIAVPVYKGSFERMDALGISFQNWQTQEAEERVRAVVRDAMVALDYLSTREDLDSSAFGYFGFSMGSVFSPNILANEPRFTVAVLASGGFAYLNDKFRPFIDPGRYLDRVRQPVLMINGEFDELFPLETHIKAFYSRLGSAEKELFVVPGAGHTLARESVFREALEWYAPRLR